MTKSFFFVTNEVEFQESTKKKGARILATFMELDTISQNKRVYRVEEGKSIARSLIGKAVRFGADWFGKHIKNVPNIGIVEKAFQEGKKIKGVIRVWDKDIVSQLKRGIKFLFSVGGVADFAEVVKKGKRVFTRLYNAVCTHLQMLPNDPKGAGFPTAKMHKIIEINESVIITDHNIKVCDAYGCRILSGIMSEYEFQEAKKKAIREKIKQKVLNRAIAQDIMSSIRAIGRILVEED